MLRRAIVIATLAPLAVPTVALGATASVATETQYRTPNKGAPQPYQVSRYSYVAGPGERNQPVLTFSESGRALTIKDDGALIAPGNGCAAVGPTEVRCAVPDGAEVPGLGIGVAVATLAVALGDGDDVVNAIADVERSVAVDAGPGADQVFVREGEARGGEGDDVLQSSGTGVALDGGGGSDVLQGGQGDDSLTGGPGRDRINGGPGRDTVVFAEETQPVTVDLARPGPAGSADEPDDVSDVESVFGGTGNDVLSGSSASNHIRGGPGRDLIDAEGGNDSLDGGPGADQVRGGEGNDELVEEFIASGAADRLQGDAGRDRIYSPSHGATLLGGAGRDLLQFPAGAIRVDGGAGNDELQAPDGTGHRLRARCGTGRDLIANPPDREPIPVDCELTTLGTLAAGALPVLTRVRVGRSTITVGLPDPCGPNERCRVRVVLRAGAREVGRAWKRTGRGRQTVRIRLRPRSHQRLRRARTLRLTYSLPYDQFPRGFTVRLPKAR